MTGDYAVLLLTARASNAGQGRLVRMQEPTVEDDVADKGRSGHQPDAHSRRQR